MVIRHCGFGSPRYKRTWEISRGSMSSPNDRLQRPAEVTIDDSQPGHSIIMLQTLCETWRGIKRSENCIATIWGRVCSNRRYKRCAERSNGLRRMWRSLCVPVVHRTDRYIDHLEKGRKSRTPRTCILDCKYEDYSERRLSHIYVYFGFQTVWYHSIRSIIGQSDMCSERHPRCWRLDTYLGRSNRIDHGIVQNTKY